VGTSSWTVVPPEVLYLPDGVTNPCP
jgi:hypothetical protein